jgi:alkylation response protein AidB-like acyl-CoA dehydrogenase
VLSARDKPGPEASILKIKGSEVQQALTELAMEAVGPAAAPFSRRAIEAGGAAAPFASEYAAPLAARYFGWRKVSIYGGSNEIQRNIIAQHVLGL